MKFSRVLFPSDRKSTRLNSSHDQISYAVFCLRSEEHTSELHSRSDFVCRLLLEKKKAAPVGVEVALVDALDASRHIEPRPPAEERDHPALTRSTDRLADDPGLSPGRD